jgi:hypothetical protein
MLTIVGGADPLVTPKIRETGQIMKTTALTLALFVCGLILLRARGNPPADLQFTADKKMILPADYREWVWLSSGLGMSYTPDAANNENPSFDNVFASPSAYQEFKKTGTWPDRAVLILEVRKSLSHSSINTSGRFQSDVAAIEAHVKDPRLPGKWAFYAFGTGTSGTLIPKPASCYTCHEQHAAVDTTFVQFYPTLLKIAQEKKTLP